MDTILELTKLPHPFQPHSLRAGVVDSTSYITVCKEKKIVPPALQRRETTMSLYIHVQNIVIALQYAGMLIVGLVEHRASYE